MLPVDKRPRADPKGRLAFPLVPTSPKEGLRLQECTKAGIRVNPPTSWAPKRSFVERARAIVAEVVGRRFAPLVEALGWIGRFEVDADGREVVRGFFKSEAVALRIGRTERTVRAWVRVLARLGFLVLSRMPYGLRFVLVSAPRVEPGLFEPPASAEASERPEASPEPAPAPEPRAEVRRFDGRLSRAPGSDRKESTRSISNHESQRDTSEPASAIGGGGFRARVEDWLARVLRTDDSTIGRLRLLSKWKITGRAAVEIAEAPGSSVKLLGETARAVVLGRAECYNVQGVLIWRLRKALGLPQSSTVFEAQRRLTPEGLASVAALSEIRASRKRVTVNA